MHNPDDNQTLNGLRTLDTQVISVIYDQYFPDVYRYVRYRLSDEHLVEDIVSEVFVRLLETSQNGRGPKSNIKGWLLSTAAHIVTDHLRRRYRHRLQSLSDELPDTNLSPHNEVEHRERQRAFQEAYAQLTPTQQHVLALRFGEGYSLEETASILGKNVNAVKALQFRALAALQRKLKEIDDD